MKNGADSSIPPDPKSTQPKSKPSCLIWLLLLAAILSFAVLSLIVIGWMEIDSSPLQISGRKDLLKPVAYSYSPDQSEPIIQDGLPDPFSSLFYEDDFGGTSTRLETWVNGKVDDQDSFQPVGGEILPAPYGPDQFTASLSLKELSGSTGTEEFLEFPLEKKLLERDEKSDEFILNPPNFSTVLT